MTDGRDDSATAAGDAWRVVNGATGDARVKIDLEARADDRAAPRAGQGRRPPIAADELGGVAG